MRPSRVLIKVGAFALAVLCAALLGCLAATQFVMAELASIGVSVPLTDRVATSGHDLVRLGPLLGVFYAAALLPGFLLAGLTRRWAFAPRAVWFSLFAALVIIALLVGARAVLGGMPVAGARTAVGILAQALAGAAAGWLYVYLTDRGATA